MTISTIIVLFGALQGFILFVMLGTLNRGNIRANRLAGIFILCIAITLLGRYAYTVHTESLLLSKLLFVGDFVIFFYGPLLYLYFLRLFNVPPTIRIPLWLHFVPLGIFAVMILPFVFFDRAEFITYSRSMESAFVALEAFAILLNAVYLVVNIRLVQSFRRISMDISSEMPRLRFYLVLLGITTMGVFFWSVSFLLRFVGPEGMQGYLGYQLVWIGLSAFIVGLGWYTLRFPESFQLPKKEEVRPVAASLENAAALKERLERIMTEQRPYLQPKLTLPELSSIAGMPVHLLSKVINDAFGMNFFEFVNAYRVEEFKRIATPAALSQRTLLALALDAGFNSKTTFNAAFKRITDMTPREYIASIKAD